MKLPAAKRLLAHWSKDSDLLPQYWNTCEPVNRPFNQEALLECARSLCASGDNSKAAVFLRRKKRPAFLSDIQLVWRAQHNEVFIGFDDAWPSGALKLREFIANLIRATGADFGYVADADKRDADRFNELTRPYTPEEFRSGVRRAPPFLATSHKDFHLAGTPATRFNYHPIAEKMYGPHGHIWDIVWYNYFGPQYVEVIGKNRLTNAAWAQVEELAGGLACLATESIEDPTLSPRREQIRNALHEFVWTPGCKREEKRAPVFDFSEQLAHAPVCYDESAGPLVAFAGMSKSEEEQAIKALEEQSGKEFDRASKTLKPKRKKKS